MHKSEIENTKYAEQLESQNDLSEDCFVHPFEHDDFNGEQFTLHQMRKASGISGATAAKMCNTSYRSILNWESGVTIPNIMNVYDLLHIYGYTLKQLDLSLFFEASDDRAKKQEQSEALLQKLKSTGRQNMNRQVESMKEPL